MPLLRKKAFETTSLPEFLRDDEEVFLCEVTNEIFRDYEEFCQRIILVNSMVWSCSMTGKTNLTYAEALNSEQAARKSIQDFPNELRIPVLYLASKTKRTNFGDMAEDIFSFVKDRYFAGEIVESSFTENVWRESHVLQVIAPTEEQIEADAKNKVQSPERIYHPSASLFRYEIEQLDADDQDSSQIMIIEASQVRRKKGPYTREKNRLFLKQYMETSDNNLWVVKNSARNRFNLDSIRFDQIFDGPLPDFEASKKAAKAMTNGKKVRQETLAKYLKKSNYFGDGTNGKKLLDDMKRREEEYKQKCADMKQKKAEEKILEKQKRREENLKMSSCIKEWYKPRDDLELEDQKKLPEPTLVQSKMPSKYFGDALMVMEFADQFSTLINTKDFFPGGLTLDLIERALTEKEVAGPLTDIIQMLLTALFNVQDEEAAENKESQADLNSEDMTETMSLSEASHLATLASGWSVSFQGMTLNRLPLYPLTVTEVLRLHLLSSGARLNEAATKWRYQQRGGYTSSDDPGLTLRVKYPHILKALALHNVNALPMGDKLKILTCLVNQLLTYADVRDAIEERLDKLRLYKSDLKSMQITERKREQEYVSTKLKIKRESKGNGETCQADLDKLQLEAEKKRADFEIKSKELIESASELQNFLGLDRAFRRYIKTTSMPGIFVENDEMNPGLCLDKIVVQKPELIDADHANTLTYVRKLLEESSCNGSDKENDNKNNAVKLNGSRNNIKVENDVDSTRELLMCTAGDLPCPVHSRDGKPEWSFYHNKEDFSELISCLNKRGIRESDLKQVLENDREPLENILTNVNPSKFNPNIDVKFEETVVPKAVSKKVQSMYTRYEDSNLGYPADTELSEVLHLSLIDNLLEMEEKIMTGCLGQLKVQDRTLWREHLLCKKYDLLDKTLVRKDDANQLEKIKSEGKTSRPGTPDSTSTYRDPGRFLGVSVDQDSDDSDNDSIMLTATDIQQTSVKALSIALAQISQAVDPKHLKKPLGRADASAKKKEECDVLERWEQSLLASTSYGQIFLHFCTLDNCIMWSRSVLLARCRICHRQRDPQDMLLCDSCNKGHHMSCLKPKLTAIPKGNWFCNKCKPKEKPPTPRASKRTRKLFTEHSDSEESYKDEKNGTASEKSNNVSTVEVCDECGSGGHVICCDFCPKVYHLECTQPPMRRVPRGEWKCYKCKRKSSSTNNHRNKEADSVDPVNRTGGRCMMGESAQRDGGNFNRRRCAAKARHKIHGFIQSLRRKSVDSGSSEDVPQRRSYRRGQDSKGTTDAMDDDLPLHNAPLQELLSDVMKHKDSWPFTRPVTKNEVPDYYEVITKPMDFGKIKYKLNMGEYKCDADVMDDCALVFDNCNTYNTSDAPVYKCGIKLLKFFEKRCRDLGLDFPENMMGDDEEEEGPTKPKKARHH